MTDATTITTLIIMAGGIIFVTGMYAYRKITTGETFNLQKYALTFGYVALVAVAAYITTSAVPDFNEILTTVYAGIPDPATWGTLLSTVAIGVLSKVLKSSSTTTSSTTTATAGSSTTVAETVKTTEATATKVAETTTATETSTESTKSTLATSDAEATAQAAANVAAGSSWSPGLTVTPTFSKGTSPLPINLTVQVGMESATGKRCKVQVDWMDGSPLEVFSPDEATGIGVISHTYKYAQGTTKYTSHSFYPEITALSSDGTKAIQSINVDGKCCEIEVLSA